MLNIITPMLAYLSEGHSEEEALAWMECRVNASPKHSIDSFIKACGKERGTAAVGETITM